MEHSHKDLYSVLKVSRTASPEQIRSAYRALAKAFHESANKEDALEATHEEKSAFTRTLRDVTNAFNILSNPVKRAEYDSQLAPLVDGQSFIPPQNGLPKGSPVAGAAGEAWNSTQRRGRANETEFMVVRPGPSVATKTAPAKPAVSAKQSVVKPAAPNKAEKGTKSEQAKQETKIISSILPKGLLLKAQVGSALSGQKKLSTHLMVLIILGSLGIGIALAYLAKQMLTPG